MQTIKNFLDKKTILTILVTAAVVALLAFTLDDRGWREGDMGKHDMHRMEGDRIMKDKMNHGNMSSMMDDVMMNMTGKTGKDLEEAFLNEMIPHHEGAVEMAQMLINSTSTPENLRVFAKSIIEAQTKEIGQMTEWLKAY